MIFSKGDLAETLGLSFRFEYIWNKIAAPEEAYALYERLRDTYGPEYTGGWYSVCFPRNGYMNHGFTVQADSDDPTMLKLGFELVRPVDQTP